MKRHLKRKNKDAQNTGTEQHKYYRPEPWNQTGVQKHNSQETRSESPEKQNRNTAPPRPSQQQLPDGTESLVRWRLTEEKKEYSRDRELVFILIGLAGVIIAVLLTSYIFAALLLLATIVFIHANRQKPKNLNFNITTIGIFLENDFLPTEEIKSFNIIDDPGERARLVLKIEKIVQVNEVVPIYDVNIRQIEDALNKLNIPKQEDLELSLLDRVTTAVL